MLPPVMEGQTSPGGVDLFAPMFSAVPLARKDPDITVILLQILENPIPGGFFGVEAINTALTFCGRVVGVVGVSFLKASSLLPAF